jgi:hypothetical protein
VIVNVFISYSAKDEREDRQLVDFAKLLEEFLRKSKVSASAGYVWRVFIASRDLEGGELWEPAIQRKLDSADFFLLMCSPKLFTSVWCGREWAYFNRRLLRSQRSGDPRGRMIPVWWGGSEHRPAIIEPIQLVMPNKHESSQGFRQVSEQQRLDYRRLVRNLANQLNQRERNLPPMAVADRAATPLGNVPPAFEPEAGGRDPRDCRVVFAVPTSKHVQEATRTSPGASKSVAVPEMRGRYGQDHTEWNPFDASRRPGSDRPVLRLVGELRRNNYKPIGSAVPFDAFLTSPDDLPTVFLVDGWFMPYLQDWLSTAHSKTGTPRHFFEPVSSTQNPVPSTQKIEKLIVQLDQRSGANHTPSVYHPVRNAEELAEKIKEVVATFPPPPLPPPRGPRLPLADR